MFQHAAPPSASRAHSARSSPFADSSFVAPSSGAPLTPYDNLSRAALQGTYLQPFRLVTPHDAIQRPTASARAAVPPLLISTIAQSNERTRARDRKRAEQERQSRRQQRLRQQEAQQAYAAKYNLRDSQSAHERSLTWEEQLHQSASASAAHRGSAASYGFTHSGQPPQPSSMARPNAPYSSSNYAFAATRSQNPQQPAAAAFDPAVYYPPSAPYGSIQQPSSRPFTSPAGQLFPLAPYAPPPQQQQNHFPSPPASPSAASLQQQQQQHRHAFSITAPLSSRVEEEEEEKQQTTTDDYAQQQLSQSTAEHHHRRASTSSRHSQAQSISQQSASQTQQQQQQTASPQQQSQQQLSQQLVPTQPASAASNYSNPFSAVFGEEDSNASSQQPQPQQQAQSHTRSQSSRSSKARRSHSSASSEPGAPAAAAMAPFVASPSMARFVPYLGSSAEQPRGASPAPPRNPAVEYVVSRSAAQRAMSATAAAMTDHAAMVSPRALPLPTPPSTAAATSTTGGASGASQQYTLRKLRASDVLQQLHFPAAPSPAEVSRSIGRLGIVTRPEGSGSSSGGGTDRKRSIGIASSSLQEKHGLAHHGSVPLPPSAAVQAAAAAHRARIENLALTAFPKPSPLPQKTMFDSPPLHPRRASAAGVETMSLAAQDQEQAGSIAAAADAAVSAAPVGFKPASDGDLLDLYFFLTDPACPIFRAPEGAAAGSTASANSSSSSTSSMLRAMMHQQQMHRDSAIAAAGGGGGGGGAAAGVDDLSGPRSAAAVAASALAAKCSIDLLSLAGLVDAAGGSVRTALAYLQQIVPRGSIASSSSGVASASPAATSGSNLLVPFDPFGSMSELVHTVRLMRERDELACVPPPVYHHPWGGAGRAGEAKEGANEAAAATRWLYASSRRVPPQPDELGSSMSFLQPAPSAAAVRPLSLSLGAKDPVLEARDRERAARIAAQQYLHCDIAERAPPTQRSDAPVEA